MKTLTLTGFYTLILVDNKTMKSLILIIELEQRGQGTSRMTSRNTKKIIRLTPSPHIIVGTITGARGTHMPLLWISCPPWGVFPLWVSHSLLSYILSIFFCCVVFSKSYEHITLHITPSPQGITWGVGVDCALTGVIPTHYPSSLS